MSSPSLNLVKTKNAIKLIFLICGVGLASWAPMVPYAKDRLGLNDANLGLLLLLLGAGALITMPISGILIHRFGSRIVIGGGVVIVSVLLPVLLVVSSTLGLGISLFIFGCGIGSVDVAMNSHGIQVQNLYKRHIMSSLHGLFSIGGLVGSLGLGFLIKLGLNPVYAAVTISALLLILVMSQYKYLFTKETEKQTIAEFSTTEKHTGNTNKFKWLNKGMLLLGIMCFAVFLSEGAMLDWSAVFLNEKKGVDPALSGVGYAAFSMAMAIMRLLGDKIITKLNNQIVVTYGGFIAATGLCIAIFSPWLVLVLLGFILLGIGTANIVPVFFSEGGKLPGISPSISIPAITTMGYAGQLAGPAILGLISKFYSLSVAFGFTALLLVLVALSYRFLKKS